MYTVYYHSIYGVPFDIRYVIYIYVHIQTLIPYINEGFLMYIWIWKIRKIKPRLWWEFPQYAHFGIFPLFFEEFPKQRQKKFFPSIFFIFFFYIFGITKMNFFLFLYNNSRINSLHSFSVFFFFFAFSHSLTLLFVYISFFATLTLHAQQNINSSLTVRMKREGGWWKEVRMNEWSEIKVACLCWMCTKKELNIHTLSWMCVWIDKKWVVHECYAMLLGKLFLRILQNLKHLKEFIKYFLKSLKKSSYTSEKKTKIRMHWTE